MEGHIQVRYALIIRAQIWGENSQCRASSLTFICHFSFTKKKSEEVRKLKIFSDKKKGCKFKMNYNVEVNVRHSQLKIQETAVRQTLKGMNFAQIVRAAFKIYIWRYYLC